MSFSCFPPPEFQDTIQWWISSNINFFRVFVKISLLFELNGLFFSALLWLKRMMGNLPWTRDIYSVVTKKECSDGCLRALWFWKIQQRLDVWSAGAVEANQQGWRDCSEGQVTSEVWRLFSFRSQQETLYSALRGPWVYQRITKGSGVLKTLFLGQNKYHWIHFKPLCIISYFFIKYLQ